MTGKPTYSDLKQRVHALEGELSLVNEQYWSLTSKLHKLEDLLDNTNTAICLKRADFTYVFVNKPFERFVKVAAENIVGKDDFMLFPESMASLFRSQDLEVIRQRKVVEFEETVQLHDGTHTFITARFPLFDKDGNIDAIGGVCTDITARKEAEARLKDAELKYRSIVEYSPLGIMQIDQDGIITTCNEKLAEILKSDVEKIIGIDLINFFHDSRVQSATSIALSGRTVQYEGWYQSFTSGAHLYLRGIFSPIYSSSGSIASVIGIIEDSTARKKAEEALQNAHDELEQHVLERTAELDQKSKRLMETNVALEILLEKREADKALLEKTVMQNIERLITPYLDKLDLTENIDTKEALVGIIRTNLEEITSSFTHGKKDLLSQLTPAQIQIVNLIKNGHTTKEIAHLLNLSPSTIACHRQEIRKRLDLTNKKVNLQSVLSAKT